MTRRFFGKVTAIAAALGVALALTLTSCDSGNGPTTHWGDSMRLTGQVWTWPAWDDDDDWDDDDWDDDWFGNWNVNSILVRFTDTLTVTARNYTGEGTITNGQLDFTIGRPPTGLSPINGLISMLNSYGWDATASGPAQFFLIEGLETDEGWLSRWSDRGSITQTRFTSTIEEVVYIFVDQDVTISSSLVYEAGTDNGFTYRFENRAFNIALREGWNAVHFREEWVENFTAAGVTTSETAIVSLSRNNPGGVRWILGGGNGFAQPLGESIESTEGTLFNRRSSSRARR